MNDPNAEEDALTLELLDAIEQRNDVSQRDLAARLGIALGLTNSYLKRCAKKGYVKVKEVPANRYMYYLTPKGFREKSRLTAQFLATSLTFYRHSAESCSTLYRECEQRGWRRVVLCGQSDLAEIAHTRSAGHGVRVVALYSPECHQRTVGALVVFQVWSNLPPADAFIVTGLDNPLGIYKTLKKHVSEPERILVPAVLGLDAAIKNES